MFSSTRRRFAFSKQALILGFGLGFSKFGSGLWDSKRKYRSLEHPGASFLPQKGMVDLLAEFQQARKEAPDETTTPLFMIPMQGERPLKVTFCSRDEEGELFRLINMEDASLLVLSEAEEKAADAICKANEKNPRFFDGEQMLASELHYSPTTHEVRIVLHKTRYALVCAARSQGKELYGDRVRFLKLGSFMNQYVWRERMDFISHCAASFDMFGSSLSTDFARASLWTLLFERHAPTGWFNSVGGMLNTTGPAKSVYEHTAVNEALEETWVDGSKSNSDHNLAKFIPELEGKQVPEHVVTHYQQGERPQLTHLVLRQAASANSAIATCEGHVSVEMQSLLHCEQAPDAHEHVSYGEVECAEALPGGCLLLSTDMRAFMTKHDGRLLYLPSLWSMLSSAASKRGCSSHDSSQHWAWDAENIEPFMMKLSPSGVSVRRLEESSAQEIPQNHLSR